MIKNMKHLIVAGLLLFVGTFSVVAFQPATVSAGTSDVRQGLSATGGTEGKKNVDNALKTVVNVLLFIIGAISVIMIILGGIKYTLSNGDSSQVTSAKNTILYAVIGLIVALLAFAIVNFVVDQFVAG